jgi:transcriptional repressor NrdR
VVDSRLSLTGPLFVVGAKLMPVSTVDLRRDRALDVTVVKRDGHRETYDREKIERGLRRALEKRSHTVPEFRQLMHAIEREIHRRKATELRSEEIGEIVMEQLKTFDKVAYIRFASVYRSFEDVKTFRDELSDLLKQTKERAREEKKKTSS